MVSLLSALSLALCHEVLEGGGYQQMGTIKYAIHCLTKATAFVPQCEIMEPYVGKQLLLSHIAWLAALAMQCDTPKAYASHRFSSWRFQHIFLQERYYDIWSQA